jgi:hypothetical protein
MSSQIPTIYDWAGGRPAFERWLGRFMTSSRRMTWWRHCSAAR